MNAILKYPGAKWRIAKKITSLFPPHKFYIEPFFGSGAVFFNKAPADYETINDIDELVINFFKACRDFPQELATAVNLTPFSRSEFMSIQEDKAGESIHLTGDCVEDARRFLVRCSQGFGSKLADRVGWKNTKHSTGPINPRVWNKLPDIVIQASARLKNAQIENTDAVKLIKDCNAKDCLVYADPPYTEDTRSCRIYRYEMTENEKHLELLKALVGHDGYVVLSGYDNELYNDTLRGWQKEYIAAYVNSGRKTTEVLWMNFEPEQQLGLL